MHGPSGAGRHEVEGAGVESEDVLAHVRRRAPEYFDATEPVLVELVTYAHRPKGDLWRIAVLQGGGRREVLVKAVREAAAPVVRDRPRLGVAVCSPGEKARLEHRALQRIHVHFSALGDRRLTAALPLEHLPRHSTIVREYVPLPTLRSLLWRSTLPRALGGPHLEDALFTTGRWLKQFHSMAVPDLPVHRECAAQVTSDLLDHLPYLAAAGAAVPQLRAVEAAATELAGDALPDHLLVAACHGDFAPRNVLIARGRPVVASIDTLMPRANPVQEDLAYFLLSLTPSGWHGTLVNQATLRRLRRSFLQGYYQDTPSRDSALTLQYFCLLVLLNKWAAGVASTPATDRARRRVNQRFGEMATRLVTAMQQ
jgi:hypothetical protein